VRDGTVVLSWVQRGASLGFLSREWGFYGVGSQRAASLGVAGWQWGASLRVAGSQPVASLGGGDVQRAACLGRW